MKTFIISAFVLSALATNDVGHAIQLQATADLSESQKSYDLKFKNVSDAEILCKSVQIELTVGKDGCLEFEKSLTDVWKNLKIKAHSTVADPNYGLEVMAKFKDKGYEFCGEPKFVFDCNPSH